MNENSIKEETRMWGKKHEKNIGVQEVFKNKNRLYVQFQIMCQWFFSLWL